MNVRCPVCGSVVRLAVGDTRLACAACGLAAPVSSVGTEPGTAAAATLALETDLTGTMLAGTLLVERIGAGGMGTVYRARRGDTDVAIKVLRPGFGDDRKELLARFAREAEALRRLEHPRVVRFLDHGEDRDAAYIVTELVEGRDLAARLAERRMTLAEIVDVFGQVCDGVAVAHAAGIVHRDLKPANILIGTDGAKVADFGLAQIGVDVSIPTLTRTNVAMGTFHYLAPEQRKDAHAVDHRTDVWALGVILYEMLTGELPLGSFTPPSTSGPPGCDRRVDAIVRRALAPDPALRHARVDELARDVRALVAPRRTRRLAVAAAATLVLAAGSTAVAFALTSHDREVPVAERTPDAGRSIDAAPAAVALADAAIDAVEVAAAPPDAAPIVPPVVRRPPTPPTGKPGKVPTGGSGSFTKPTGAGSGDFPGKRVKGK
jgi:serine/threonine-protein kinase